MKIALTILLLIFSNFLILSQNDSINRLLVSNQNNDTLIANLKLELAYQNLRKSPSKSYEYILEVLKISESKNLKIQSSKAYTIKGIIKKNNGDYQAAVEAHFLALKYAKELGDEAQESVCYNNLGSVYQAQLNFEKSLEYYKKALAIEEKLKRKSQIALTLYNMGTVYEMKIELDKAYTHYYNSLLIEEELNNPEGIYFAYYGLAGVDSKRKDYHRALNYIEKALEIANKIGDSLGIAQCYNESAKLYLNQGNHSKSKELILSSNEIAKRLNLANLYKDNLLILSRIAEMQNDFQSSLLLLKQYNQLNDSLSSIEVSAKVAEIESRFELDKSEARIHFLEEKEQLLKVTADTQSKLRYFLLSVILILLTLSISNLYKIFSNYRQLMLIIGLTVFVLFLIAIALNRIQFSIWSIKTIVLSFLDVLTFAVFPIYLFILFLERTLLNKHIKIANELNNELKDIIPQSFVDQQINIVAENKKDKLSFMMSDLLYISSQDNYSEFHFTNSTPKAKELLRGSLKLIEEQAVQYPEMIRCHKSYIVNLSKIESIEGNAKGYKLKLINCKVEIPVSRNFPKEIINRLKNQ